MRVILIYLIALIPICANAQKLIEKKVKLPGEISIPYEKYKLGNGLVVILHQDTSNPMVVVNLTYNVGSANDESCKSGMAHFFEHLMFQGSKNIKSGEHMKTITEIGGRANGQTFQDKTMFYNVVPNNQLEKVLMMESDRMGFLLDSFTKDKFLNEKKTILNERMQSVDNIPFNKIEEVSSYFFYPANHPYRKSTMGFTEDIQNISFEDLQNFYLQWYNPGNAILFIAGDIKFKETLSLVNKYFGSLKNHALKNKQAPDLSDTRTLREFLIKDKIISQPILQVKFPSVKKFHKDWAALECLAYILGGDDKSFLKKNIANDSEVKQIFAHNFSRKLAGDFTILLLGSDNFNISNRKQIIFKLLSGFDTVSIDFLNSEIKKFKQTIEFRRIYGIETLLSKTITLLDYEIVLGQPDFFEKELNLYRELTPGDILRVFKKYLRKEDSFILSSEHSDSSLDMAKIARCGITQPEGQQITAKTISYKPYDDKINRHVLPQAETNVVCPKENLPVNQELFNGVKIISQYNDVIPVVSLQVNIRLADESFEDSTAFLIKLLAKMLAESGTANLTAEQISEILKSKGIYFYTSASENVLTIQLKCLKKYWSTINELLEEKILKSKLTEEAFKNKLSQLINENTPGKADATTIANNVFHSFLLSSLRAFTYPQCISNNFTLADVQRLYNSIRGNDIEIVTYGDIKSKEIVEGLSFLKNLKDKSETKNIPQRGVDTLTIPTIYIMNMPNATQTILRIGLFIDKPFDLTDTIYKLSLANFILGGHFNSRLNLNLRQKLGYTYKAYSYLTGNKKFSRLFIETSVNPEFVVNSINEIFSELSNFKKNGISNEELSFLKPALQNKEFINNEGAANRMQLLNAIISFNNQNYKEKQCEVLHSISKQEINEIINKFLTIGKMKILIAGNVNNVNALVASLAFPVKIEQVF